MSDHRNAENEPAEDDAAQDLAPEEEADFASDAPPSPNRTIFLCALHQDGTLDGCGEAQNRQKIRTGKCPRAARILPDPAGRIFVVQKPGGASSAAMNPSNDEDDEEQHTGGVKGKLKDCTSVALSHLFIFAVKPAP